MIRVYRNVTRTVDRTRTVAVAWGLTLGRLRLEVIWRTALGARMDRDHQAFVTLLNRAIAASDRDSVLMALEACEDHDASVAALRRIADGETP